MPPRLFALLAPAAILAACGGSPSETQYGARPQLTPLHQAVNACDADVLYANLADQDKSLTLDGKGEADQDGLSDGTIGCILDTLGSSVALTNTIMSTRATDGIQRDTWTTAGGDYKATWSFSPSHGLMLIIQMG